MCMNWNKTVIITTCTVPQEKIIVVLYLVAYFEYLHKLQLYVES